MKTIAIAVLMISIVGCVKPTKPIYVESDIFQGSLATDCRVTTNDHAKPCHHKQTK